MASGFGLPRRRSSRLLAAFPVAIVCSAATLAACSGQSGPNPSAPSSASGTNHPQITATPSSTPSGPDSLNPTPSPEPSSLTPPQLPGVHWTISALSPSGSTLSAVARLDGGRVGLLWMNSDALRFRLIPGYQVPESSPVRAMDRIPATWVPQMVAAFNGGFRLKDHLGGYFYAGKTVSPLIPGVGSLMVLDDGRLQVGAWGDNMKLSSRTVAVRQELPLLVSNYQSMANNSQGADYWGRTNGSLPNANRSALGQLSDGALVYAEGSEVTPVQLASALIKVGVRHAMVLDMNKSWPNAFVYTRQGGQVVGQKVQQNMWRQPSIYYQRFTKDFIVAEKR